MTGKEQIFGVLACLGLILCILQRELITFIPFYVLPILLLSLLASLLFAVPMDQETNSIDYKDLVPRLFIAGGLAVILLLSFGERAYDQKGNVVRIEVSQDINATYNSWTKKLVMGIDVLRPAVYEESPYDGTTWLKMVALVLAIGGPLMSLAMQGWYLPAQKKKEEKKKEEEAPDGQQNLQGRIHSLQWEISNLQKDMSKKDIEVQSLRAENRGLKKKLGDG